MDRRVTDPLLRTATLSDAPAIESLMKASTRDLFPTTYDASQTASAVEYVAHLDRTVVEDGTYYVFEVGDEIVACGGWSRRGKLYTGSGDASDDARLIDPAIEPARIRAMFTRADWTRRGLGRRILEACEAAARAEGFRALTLGATMPGLPLYLSFGFHETGRDDILLPDGILLECAWMDKDID